MKDCKLIVSDLDRTLLLHDMTLSEENATAIDKFTQLGINFVPSSGRTLYEIPECVRENPNVRYVIYSNGSAIYDKEKGCDIVSHRITKEDVNRIVDIISDYDVFYGAQIDGKDYYNQNKLNEETYKHYQINPYYAKLLSNGAHADDVETLARNAKSVELFIVFFHNDSELKEAKARLESELCGLNVTDSVEHELEISSAEAGKGAALSELCEHLNISGDNVIAIGDSANDTSMFPYAKLAICVSNGADYAKELADEIGVSSEEHIADYVLKKHVENDVSKGEEKTLKSKLIKIASAAVVIFAVIASILAFGIDSVKKVGYIGNNTASSWSGTYKLLDGEMKHTITPSDDTLSFSIKTESGSISIEVIDREGNTIFEKDDIGTEAFDVKVDGKVKVIIEADDHKGSFVIG